MMVVQGSSDDEAPTARRSSVAVVRERSTHLRTSVCHNTGAVHPGSVRDCTSASSVPLVSSFSCCSEIFGRNTQDTCVDVGTFAGFFHGICTALMRLLSRENFKLGSRVVVAAFDALVAWFVCVLSDRPSF